VNFREIRFASPQYDEARVLREMVLRRPLGLTLSEADLADEGAQLHFGLYLDHEELVSCVIAVPLSANEAKIRQTAVAPQFQRRGIGRLLIRELETTLASKGFSRLSMHARVDASGFYRKLGYRTVGDPFLEVTIPHVRMIKTLET